MFLSFVLQCNFPWSCHSLFSIKNLILDTDRIIEKKFIIPEMINIGFHKSAEYKCQMFRFDDNESQSSGDSILIGVEEDKDFRDYKVIFKSIFQGL